MRWRTPGEQTQNALLLPVLIPLLLVATPPILLLAGAIWLSERIWPPFDWRPWFAWHPVRIVDWGELQAEWHWLETVERKRVWSGENSYRRLTTPQGSIGEKEYD